MRMWLKRIGYAIGGLVLVLAVSGAAIFAMSESRFRRTYVVPPETLATASDSATLARGEHLASAVAGCIGCHGPGLRGQPVFDAAPMGRLIALNLTSGEGGVGATLTPELIEHAVRHGVGHDGRALRIMPSDDYQYLSDDDMRSLIAYVQHLAPVNNVLAPSKLMMLPRALLVAGKMPLLMAEGMRDSAAKPMSVAPGETADYGSYLAIVAGCRKCHGMGFSGGKMDFGDPAWGPSANLTKTGNLGKWTEAQFIETMRTGKRPDGYELKEPMPWQVLGKMTDGELRAIWMYLQSRPRREFGNH